VNGIINEERLRELIDGRVKAMKPEKQKLPWWMLWLGVACFVVALGFQAVGARIDRLESIVATDREFAHGIASSVDKTPDTYEKLEVNLSEPIAIHPRPATEPLPAAKEEP
jgi:hypothetical protein